MPRALVTGSSGYVGGRLVTPLVAAGWQVRCLARTPAKLAAARWAGDVEIVAGDAGGDLSEAMADVDVAVYLIHSIGQGDDWATREQVDAENFGRYAAAAGVGRIIYLGGLGSDDDELSDHLKSRHEVGRELAIGGVEVVELRAGVIIGSGSASFEMLRYLVEVLPIMVTPRWVTTRCQPIAIADVIDILVRTVTTTEALPSIAEIGGPDVVSYAEMMATYAEVAGLARRRLIKVPLLTPGLSSRWVGLVTPVPVPLARELVESLVNEVTLGEGAAPPWLLGQPMGLREAIRRALAATEIGDVPTRFVDADLVHFSTTPTDPEWSGGTVLRDVRTATTPASPGAVFAAVFLFKAHLHAGVQAFFHFGRGNRLPFGRRQLAGPGPFYLHHFVARIAHEPGKGRVDPDEPAIRMRYGKRHFGLINYLRQQGDFLGAFLHALLQQLFGQDRFMDVVAKADVAGKLAVE